LETSAANPKCFCSFFNWITDTSCINGIALLRACAIGDGTNFRALGCAPDGGLFGRPSQFIELNA
jgi:hypothetical protein